MTNEAGLQFSGEPTERALHASIPLAIFQELKEKHEENNYAYYLASIADVFIDYEHVIIEALTLMAGEKK
jgi:hypothetical protein